MGISEATFYRWKQLYGGLIPSEVKKLRQLEEENARLRKVVADLTWTRRRFRRWSAANYDACSGMRDDRPGAYRVWGVDPQGLPSHSGLSCDVSLLFPPTRAGVLEEAHPRGRREEGLQMRLKPRRRRVMAKLRGDRSNATGPNQVWAMDWMHDELFDGRRLWVLTFVDTGSRSWSESCESGFAISL